MKTNYLFRCIMKYGSLCLDQGYYFNEDIKKSLRAEKYRKKVFELILKETSKENKL